MKFKILNKEGKDTGREISLDDNIFGVEENEHVVYLAVKQYLAAQRQGTSKAKQRGEVSGSTKKLRKQKGSGNARVGSIKNPVFGNGRVHGPQPRDYNFKLNKKVKTLASKVALSSKAKDNSIMIVEDFSIAAPKTKDYLKILSSLGLANKKSIFVTNSDTDTNLYLSSRNVPNSLSVSSDNINVYDIIHCETLVLSESSVNRLQERLS